ncbi:low-temperature viability ltv1 [Lecanosticta acicola]|uniref:Low-temperature viability ltv1 n=1 Tax=Lecanosticta acicola TaxID=111012 RepID=A0AAI9E7N5_9PEZI|nr:low-temperature viability ltv1 [Lecanosticta acicola]
MPRRKFIDKKSAVHFQLVHRAQNDPLINDENAPSMVFAEVEKQQPRRAKDDDYAYSSAGSVYSGASYRSKKTKQRGDLEEEFGLSVRKNEGEAAQHGVFFDDTQYDYMQHMRDLGAGEGAVTWVEASVPQDKKGKGKQRLEDALRDMDLDDTRSVGQSSMTSEVARSLLPEEVLPSEFVKKKNYQDQQDIPDDIAGFQPDMDPRLREVLEALDDEEYVDDEEDIFAELTLDGYEVERDEWERFGEQQLFDDEDDAGWESDDTIKAPASPREARPQLDIPEGEEVMPPEDPQAVPTADPTEGAWLDEFKKFKSAAKAEKAEKAGPAAAPSTLESSALSSLATGRRKKRKGARTSTTNYSMTSSALARTGPLTTLDERFDKMENAYSLAEFPEEEEDGYLAENASAVSGMTGMSKASRVSKYSSASGLSGVSGVSSYSRATDSEAPQLVRSDMDGIMDEFLANHSKAGKRGTKVKRFGPQTGLEQLDEVRRDAGGKRYIPQKYLRSQGAS